jgi:hypothetical protein
MYSSGYSSRPDPDPKAKRLVAALVAYAAAGPLDEDAISTLEEMASAAMCRRGKQRTPPPPPMGTVTPSAATLSELRRRGLLR